MAYMTLNFMKFPAPIIDEFLFRVADKEIFVQLEIALKEIVPGPYRFIEMKFGNFDHEGDYHVKIIVYSTDPFALMRLSEFV